MIFLIVFLFNCYFFLEDKFFPINADSWIFWSPLSSGDVSSLRRTMHTDKDKRSICAASTRRSSESLTLSALFGSDWPKPEIDSGNEEALVVSDEQMRLLELMDLESD